MYRFSASRLWTWHPSRQGYNTSMTNGHFVFVSVSVQQDVVNGIVILSPGINGSPNIRQPQHIQTRPSCISIIIPKEMFPVVNVTALLPWGVCVCEGTRAKV